MLDILSPLKSFLEGFGPIGAALVVVAVILWKGRSPTEFFTQHMVTRIEKLELIIAEQTVLISRQAIQITKLTQENASMSAKLEWLGDHPNSKWADHAIETCPAGDCPNRPRE